MAHWKDTDKEDGKRRIPNWDSNPSTFYEYKDAVKIWALGENLDVNYCVAARLIPHLSGAAYTIATTIPEADLMPRRRGTRIPITRASSTEFEEIPIPIQRTRSLTGIAGPQPGATRPGTASTDAPDAAAVPVPEDEEEDLMRGIHNLLDYLENILQRGKALQIGTSMQRFFQTREFWRRPGESISEYIPRFDKAVRQLYVAGVDLKKIEDLCGFFFLVMLGISLDRREKILTRLPDDHYDLQLIYKACLQLFPNLTYVEAPGLMYPHHAARNRFGANAPTYFAEGLQRPFFPRPHPYKPSSQLPRDPQGKWKSQRGRRFSTFEASAERQPWADIEDSDVDDGDFDEADDPQPMEVEPADFGSLAQSELEALSTEVCAYGGDLTELFPEDVVFDVENAAQTLTEASDALATIRDARTRLSKGKGRSYGQPLARAKSACGQAPPQPQATDFNIPGQTSEAPAVSQKSGKSGGKRSLQQMIASKKAKTRCRVCGEFGHWAGDPECRLAQRQQSRNLCLADLVPQGVHSVYILARTLDAQAEQAEDPTPFHRYTDVHDDELPPLVSDSDSDIPLLVPDTESHEDSSDSDADSCDAGPFADYWTQVYGFAGTDHSETEHTLHDDDDNDSYVEEISSPIALSMSSEELRIWIDALHPCVECNLRTPFECCACHVHLCLNPRCRYRHRCEWLLFRWFRLVCRMLVTCGTEDHGAHLQTELHTVQSVHHLEPEVLQTGLYQPGEISRGIVDTACALTVAGSTWWNQYQKILDTLSLSQYITVDPCCEYFRFGNGATSRSSQKVKAPAVIAGQPQLLDIHLVDERSLGLLLGRDWFEKTQALIDIAHRVLIFSDRQEPILPNPGGHFSVELHPETFIAI